MSENQEELSRLQPEIHDANRAPTFESLNKPATASLWLNGAAWIISIFS